MAIDLIPVDLRTAELLGAAILEEPEPAMAALRSAASPEGRGGSPGEWKFLAADTAILRRMREAFLAGLPYAHEIPRSSAWEEDGTSISAGADPRTFAGGALAEIYGQLLGSTLGHVLGLTFPSWRLGDGLSFGSLLARELSSWQLLPLSGARRLRERLARLAETTATLLASVAVPGFEAGFPRICEPYGTGLYFPPAAVREIHGALGRSRKPLVSLLGKATGRERAEIEPTAVAIQEAFAWAARHDRGLMEGDELAAAG
jgi:hypothetical protein